MAPNDEPFHSYGFNDLADVPAFLPIGASRRVRFTGSIHDEEGNITNDRSRIARTLSHLREKIERPETIIKLPAIINSFMDNIQTDLSPEQISQLACLGTKMPRSNIMFASFPLDLFEPGHTYDPVLEQDVFVWDTDFGVLRSYVSQFQEGAWPSSSPSGPSEPEASSCE